MWPFNGVDLVAGNPAMLGLACALIVAALIGLAQPICHRLFGTPAAWWQED